MAEATRLLTESKSISGRAFLFLALILPIFAIAPLFYPGYLQTHHGFIPLWNVVDLRANLGQWNWTPHLALQFDPLRSDGLLPYYLAGLLPVSPVAAVKVVLGLGWLLGSAGLFLWLRSWLGGYGALVSSLVYTYLPFQIATVYVRGAWGESLFWGLLPWALLAATYLVGSPRPLLLPVAAVLWLALGLSHLGLTIWALIFVILVLVILHFRQALLPGLAAVLGTGVAVIVYLFLAPWNRGSPTPFADHFLYPFQLFSAYWGFGPSRPGWNDGLSFQLGLAAVGLTILTVALWQGGSPLKPQPGRTDRRLLFFLGAAIVFVLLQFSPAAFLWRLPIWPGFSLASLLTYPWQLLGLAGLCLAVLAGAALWLDSRLTQLPLFGAIIILVISSSYAYLEPQFVQADPFIASDPVGPQAQLGPGRLALLHHAFDVSISGNTAGLNRGETSVPVALYGPLPAHNRLLLKVTWQPLRGFNQDWKVFVHLVDANDNVLAQYDGYPRSGDYPTSEWIPGELIEDRYPLLFPADAPPGPYRLFLGLYDEETLARMPVPSDSEGRVILDVE